MEDENELQQISNIDFLASLGVREKKAYSYKLADDEYYKDGLIYCKKCNTPRNCLLNDGKYIAPIKCDCQRAALEIERQKMLEIALKIRIDGLKRTCVPITSYRNYTLANDDRLTPKISELCKRYIAKFAEFRKSGQGLIFYGGVGTGKTFFAMCIANALIDNGISAKCTSLSNVIKLALDFNNADRNFYRLLDNDCFILDDFGVERKTSFGLESAYDFINSATTQNKPLIITTNLSLTELKQASEDNDNLDLARMYSRILEKCYPIKINDIKRRNAKSSGNMTEMAEMLFGEEE